MVFDPHQIPRFPQLSFDYLHFHAVLPLEHTAERLLVATGKVPVDIQVVDDLTILFGISPEFQTFDEPLVREGIERVYHADSQSSQAVLHEIGAGEASTDERIAIDDLRAQANDAPVIRLVNALLREALDARASDVHLESGSHALKVRFRVDGLMHTTAAPPSNVSAAVLSRIKIMADLDIAERRLPQDGRIRLTLDSRSVDVRVSTLPALHGESVVLRLLETARGNVALSDLGLAPDLLAQIRAIIRRPHGMLLITGPTGSGKTTTLYALLNELRDGARKIITVEDPVEYDLGGVTQVQVNAKIGLSFPAVLRAALRQDPDIIMVGEIRDAETAAIAVNAALTGHLVLATLHTNSAAGAITRLMDLGIPPYLLASSVDAVIAQRLVRRLCHVCAFSNSTTGGGCTRCRSTGYSGRIGVFELLNATDDVRRAIAANADTHAIHQAAVAAEMRTLYDDGERLVKEGTTSQEELFRAVRL